MNELIELFSGGTFQDGVLVLSYSLLDPEFYFRIFVALFLGYLMLAIVNLFGGRK